MRILRLRTFMKKSKRLYWATVQQWKRAGPVTLNEFFNLLGNFEAPLPPHPIHQLFMIRYIAFLLQWTFCPVKLGFPAALRCQMFTLGHAFNLFCNITRGRPWNISHVLSALCVCSRDTYRSFILVRIYNIRFRKMCRKYRKCILPGHLRVTPMKP